MTFIVRSINVTRDYRGSEPISNLRLNIQTGTTLGEIRLELRKGDGVVA
ncbi:hypothetical protein [Paenibacillus amylolyticus]|nr:hypothetical protein [Paenibacillus amylolyticus]MCL6663901.1 hypothetical protein [Paenibacillus amylolyticus]